MDDFTTVVNAIDAVGTLAAFIWIAYSFASGKIVSQTTYQDHMKLSEDIAIRVLANGFAAKIESAVESGVLKALDKSANSLTRDKEK